MKRSDKITVLGASLLFFFNLLIKEYRFAAAFAFMAIMLTLIGIEEQL